MQQPQHSAGASDPPKAARSAANEAKSAILAAPQINDDPQQLLGLSGVAVARRLGAPSLVRRDGPAEIWQYRETACILDVFLYTNTDGQHVRYVELRSRDTTTRPQRRCFAKLLEAEMKPPSG